MTLIYEYDMGEDEPSCYAISHFVRDLSNTHTHMDTADALHYLDH